ncbi:hypothetical protein EB796_015086 [Bugula neritina]|uniref:Uncharacterized protein n=1 Tax=Bugula neritina TaxID=10212 RepID=A0A7J7JJY1_BUGNE|nr:hypothetical protein EB796_015086 [Bugula neritina]
MTRIKKELEAFRLKVDENVWSDVELGESSIDLAGKRLHLFQLPLDMPPSCLHGVELPVPRKNKWSKPITVSYTSNEGKSNQRVCVLKLQNAEQTFCSHFLTAFEL